MKTLGLIGGMSWESTVLYYQLINRRVRETLGGLHSAKCIIFSFDFAEIEALQAKGNWEQAGKLLQDAAVKLEQTGAAAIVVCTNTMHKLAPEIESKCSLPLLHIADLTAQEIVAKGFKRVALLGTRYTMVDKFYKGRLVEKFGLDVLVPNAAEIEVVHTVIYDELCRGIVKEESRSAYVETIGRLVAGGGEGVILGCTEICLLIEAKDVSVPVFDSTSIHAIRAADWAIQHGE